MLNNAVESGKAQKEIGMNYSQLRAEGIKYIQSLSGDIWTDYNEHDPGITILEILTYAITDLSYRTSFSIEDLLTEKDSENSLKQFFMPEEILYCNPVTVDDYRKLLLDIDGVRHVWVHPLKNGNALGTYNVVIHREHRFHRTESELREDVLKKLNSNRNICERFGKISFANKQELTFDMDIIIEDNINPNSIIAIVYHEIYTTLNPEVRFYSIKEMLNKGYSFSNIIEGPLLKNGFIDNEELKKLDLSKEIHHSDYIRKIMDLEGIISVDNMKISSKDSALEGSWSYRLKKDHIPELENIDNIIINNNFRIWKNGVLCSINVEIIKMNLHKIKSQINFNKLNTTESKGIYRDLSDYETIQNDFPLSYGIGAMGLPNSSDKLRKGQSNQLRSFLMFFDQILVNYFSQLDNFKTFFAVDQNSDVQTYFSQTLQECVVDSDNKELYKDIFNKEYIDSINNNTEDNIDRKNRVLDHLLSRFSEKITDFSLDIYDSVQSNMLIEGKNTFLSTCNKLRAERYQAINLLKKPNDKDTFGIKSIILSKYNLNKQIYDISLVEHFLLETSGHENNFKLTYIISCCPIHFLSSNFKKMLIVAFHEETPAHISYEVKWLKREDYIRFREAYKLLIDNQINEHEKKVYYSNRISEYLELAKCFLEADENKIHN